MATVRKRNSGFSTSPEKEEEIAVEGFLDESVREMFETISREEEATETKNEVVEPKPFVPMEITPTEDHGPRFVDETATPPAKPLPSAPTPQLQPLPKRHPRNIPKFSRHK